MQTSRVDRRKTSSEYISEVGGSLARSSKEGEWARKWWRETKEMEGRMKPGGDGRTTEVDWHRRSEEMLMNLFCKIQKISIQETRWEVKWEDSKMFWCYLGM